MSHPRALAPLVPSVRLAAEESGVPPRKSRHLAVRGH